MLLAQVMTQTPSVRSFKPDPVPDAVIERALELARFAPSGGNRQGWRVIVVQDPELRRRGAEIYRPLWDTYEERGRKAATGDPRRLAQLARSRAMALSLAQVPVHLWICVELGALHIADRDLDRPSIVGGASIYPFVQNLILALSDQGVGSSLTTLAIPAEPEIKSLLRIPAGHALAAFLAVGWPESPGPRRLRRRAVAEFATRDYFDGPPLVGGGESQGS